MSNADRRPSRRVFLKQGMAGLTAALTPGLVRAGGSEAGVTFMWSGAVTPTTAVVKAQLNRDVTVRLAVSARSDLANPVYSAPVAVTTATNRIARLPITGLSPNTQYHYAIVEDGTVSSPRGTFKTFPEGPGSFSFAFGSCAGTGSNSSVFSTIAAQNPLFLLHLGDLFYSDIAANSRNQYRQSYNAVLASPRQSALYRQVPIAYTWDDHDYGPNNSDRNAPGREAARLTYQEYVPHYPLVAGSGNVPIYHAFTVGRVRVILTDLRSERSYYLVGDSSNKTMMGTAQKNWFKQELLAAKDRYPVVVWMNSMPWIGTDGSDGWHQYPTERRELGTFIKQNNIRNLLMLCGDAHMLAIDDGRNAGYATGGGGGFPVFHGSAFDSGPSQKGGPYSHGVRPGAGQFGFVTITDEGGSEVRVRLSGRDANNTEHLSLNLSYPATPVAPPAPNVRYLWSGAITATSAQVRAKLDQEARVRLVVSPNANLSNPVRGAFGQANANTGFVALLPISGLAPNTRYFYAVEHDQGIETNLTGQFKTGPDGPATFQFAVGSGAATGSNHAVFDTIRSHDPLLFLHLGDLHQEDIRENSRPRYRAAYDRVMGAARQAALYRQVPLVYIWDDHDYGANNSDRNAPGREAARAVYQNAVPHYPLAQGTGNVALYHTFTIGRARFIVTDLRSERSPVTDPDGPAKTMLGATQKQWFKQQVQDANGVYPVIFWVNPQPWIGDTGDDGWGQYATERRELAEFFYVQRIHGLILLTGDAGMLALDEGGNNPYGPRPGAPGFPILHAGALDADAGVRGGPYSHGMQAGRGLFGLVTVTDQGGNTVEVALAGRNAANTEVMRLTVPLSTTPQVEYIWAGAVTATSAVVKARVDRNAAVRLMYGTDASFATALQTEPAQADLAANNRVVTFQLTGLDPDTTYYYAIAHQAGRDLEKTGRLRTFFENARPFTFAFGAAAGTGSDHRIFDTIRAQDPLFFLHLGNMHQEHIAVPEANRFLLAYDRVLDTDRQAALYRQVPLVYIWDDHDYGANNSDRSAPGREAARAVYQNAVPHYPLAQGTGDVALYHAFSVGRARFIVTDLRSERSPVTDPDGPDKTMLGAAQKRWFKQQVQAANGVYPVIFWVNPQPWIGDTGNDGWGQYDTERRELTTFIHQNQVRGLVMLGGGTMLAIDDGAHRTFDFPVFHAGPLDSGPRERGGPYSEGVYLGANLYGQVTVQDRGGDEIEVQMTGLDADNRTRMAFSVYFGAVSTDTEDATEVPAELTLESYPNPVHDRATFRFSLPEPMQVSLNVFDVAGRQVAHVTQGAFRAGVHQVAFDAHSLAAGLYFGRLQTPKGQRIVKIMRA